MLKNRTFEEQFRDMLKNSVYGKCGTHIKPITIEISPRSSKISIQDHLSLYPKLIKKEGKL